MNVIIYKNNKKKAENMSIHKRNMPSWKSLKVRKDWGKIKKYGPNGNASATQLLKEGKKLAYKEINMFTAVNLFKTNASDFISGAAAEALEAYEAK